MVWSPLSNYLLYGETANLKALKASGILMGSARLVAKRDEEPAWRV
jgi:hypothetical protein